MSTTTISGGNFMQGKLTVSDKSNIIIKGGTFTGYALNNVKSFVADGYEAIEKDGVITVISKVK